MEKDRKTVLVVPIVVLIGVAIAWAGSQGGATLRGVPVFALAVGLVFLVQWLAFIPAYLTQSERFFDLTGSLTYVSVTVLAAWLSAPIGGRSLVLAALVVVWAARLGAFLFRRVRGAGKDDRFDEIKPSLIRFLNVWTIQAMWVTLTLAAALAAITSASQSGLDTFAVAGLIVWVAGFAIEATADMQKNRFRADAGNKGAFISTGLWSWSRHPNYFGEIVLWIGVAIITVPVLQSWQLITLISPIFVFLLITRVSGIPLLEAKADATWGGEDAYETYKERTPILVPLPPRR
jgi:steroid 5-alpha reductase family enzyme